MTAKTYSDLLAEVPAHLVADAEVPVLDGLQRQGDLYVVPWVGVAGDVHVTRRAVPAEGIDMIIARDGGHAHTLVADGNVAWSPTLRGGTDLGVVTVPRGSQAYLLHAEHGATGIAPGDYLLRRQREQAETQRVVAD